MNLYRASVATWYIKAQEGSSHAGLRCPDYSYLSIARGAFWVVHLAVYLQTTPEASSFLSVTPSLSQSMSQEEDSETLAKTTTIPTDSSSRINSFQINLQQLFRPTM
ncbi:hypothetical protein ACSBR2_012314 [Camellia fascicularis]